MCFVYAQAQAMFLDRRLNRRVVPIGTAIAFASDYAYFSILVMSYPN